MRTGIVLALLFALALALPAAALNITVNGKTVTVPIIEQDGHSYVQLVPLIQAMGGTVAYDGSTDTAAVSMPNGGGAGSVGMPELAGDNGVFGKVYTVRKGQPIDFSLISAEYTTEQVVIGTTMYAPKTAEKLLVLHFTVQNPNKEDELARGDALRLTVVDAADQNHVADSTWGDADSQQEVAIKLKPSQKINAYAVITVPAKNLVPKLIVQSNINNDGPVLRYDLHGVVKGLSAPIADPKDPTGASALQTVPGVVGATYPYDAFDITVNSFSYSNEALGGTAPPAGGKYLVATITLKNDSGSDHLLRDDQVKPLLTDTDGANLYYGGMLFATANRAVGQYLKAGAEMTVRLYFAVPKDSTPQTLELKEWESRSYDFPVTLTP